GNEYKARPAPTTEVPKTQKSQEHKKIKGELVRVDPDNNTLFVRVDNGTVPFKFNDCTEGEGMDQPQPQAKMTDTFNGVSALVGTEGSEVTVQWADVKGVRVALLVVINEVGTA